MRFMTRHPCAILGGTDFISRIMGRPGWVRPCASNLGLRCSASRSRICPKMRGRRGIISIISRRRRRLVSRGASHGLVHARGACRRLVCGVGWWCLVDRWPHSTSWRFRCGSASRRALAPVACHTAPGRFPWQPLLGTHPCIGGSRSYRRLMSHVHPWCRHARHARRGIGRRVGRLRRRPRVTGMRWPITWSPEPAESGLGSASHPSRSTLPTAGRTNRSGGRWRHLLVKVCSSVSRYLRHVSVCVHTEPGVSAPGSWVAVSLH